MVIRSLFNKVKEDYKMIRFKNLTQRKGSTKMEKCKLPKYNILIEITGIHLTNALMILKLAVIYKSRNQKDSKTQKNSNEVS